MVGLREQATDMGRKELIVPYPRIEEIQDESIEDGGKIGVIGAGTAGCVELYKAILLKDVPHEKLKRFETYLNEYYRMRLWNEAGIHKVPVMVGDEDLAIQNAEPKVAKVHSLIGVQ